MKRSVKQLALAIKTELMNPSNRHVQGAKTAMGKTLLKLIRQAYKEKSVGHRDEQGISWKKTKRFKETGEPMMIRSGDLLNGFQVEHTPTGLRVVNNVPYAKFALGVRPPWKSNGKLPREWVEKLAFAARPFIVKLATEIATKGS